MSDNSSIKISALKESELGEADRILRVAFGTFLRMPNPVDFMGDRQLLVPRWKSSHVEVVAAHDCYVISDLR
jgi:hypothetical protein